MLTPPRPTGQETSMAVDQRARLGAGAGAGAERGRELEFRVCHFLFSPPSNTTVYANQNPQPLTWLQSGGGYYAGNQTAKYYQLNMARPDYLKAV